MTNSTNLELPYLAPAQAQKHVTVNEALRRLDALVQPRIASFGETAPPASPNDGDVHIPGSGASGAWDQWDYNLAYYVDGAWEKIVPKTGWVVWSESESQYRRYVGAPGYWPAVSNRERLTSTRTYYVAVNGDDTADGLSQATAFASHQRAIDEIAATLDLGVHDAVIETAPGVYDVGAATIWAKQCVGSGRVIIRGDAATPDAVVLQMSGGAAADLFYAANVQTKNRLEHLKVNSLVSAGLHRGIYADSLSNVEIDNLVFGDFAAGGTGVPVFINDNAKLLVDGPLEFAGDYARGFQVAGGGVLRMQGKTITLTNAPHFSSAFLTMKVGGLAIINSLTFVGAASGKKYDLDGLSIAGAANSSLPGDVAGTTTNGAVFIQ